MTDKAEPVADAELMAERRLASALHEADVYGIGATSDFNQKILLQAAKELAALRSRPSAVPVAWRDAVGRFVDELCPNGALIQDNGNVEASWHCQGREWFKLNFTAAIEHFRNASPSPERDTPREHSSIVGHGPFHHVTQDEKDRCETCNPPSPPADAVRAMLTRVCRSVDFVLNYDENLSQMAIDELTLAMSDVEGAALSPDAGGQR